MKKQVKQLILLLLVLLLLGGALFAVKHFNGAKNVTEEEEKGTVLVDAQSWDIIKIGYDYLGESLSFVKEEDTWHAEGDADREIIQSYITSMVDTCAMFTAKQTIENVSDLDQYGLGDTAQSLHFETDTKSYDFLLGNYNDMSDVSYICEKGSDQVYVIDSSLTAFQHTLDDVTEVTEEEAEGEEIAQEAESQSK